ncbi:MAG: hypothetical protein U0350_50210 [Caldilineaceae bacterium]
MPTAKPCPFCAILKGDEPGKIIARDDERKFALIQSIHPGSVIHWLALPYEHTDSTEELERTDRERFLNLIEFAIRETRRAAAEHPELVRGFTMKLHFGSFETLQHAKVHIVAVE